MGLKGCGSAFVEGGSEVCGSEVRWGCRTQMNGGSDVRWGRQTEIKGGSEVRWGCRTEINSNSGGNSPWVDWRCSSDCGWSSNWREGEGGPAFGVRERVDLSHNWAWRVPVMSVRSACKKLRESVWEV